MAKVNRKGLILKKLDNIIGETFGQYSKYIIQERALPDLRDGLKPVQRRVLYAMNQLRLTHESAYKKSARVVGDVIGKYHPHGDSSVYEAMVRLGQEWKVRMPLIEMHGNYGSIDGDSPAAMRYTEARLGMISQYLLQDIDKGLVTFAPNFDDTELEPTVLPAQYPNILVNGASGIASGYSTTIPPHNFNEVLRALIFVLNNENVRLSDLTKIIKGPDYPTGGFASSKETIREMYKTGKGKITLRAKMSYDAKKSEIIITELPFEVVKSDLVRKIDTLISEGQIPALKSVRDDSDRMGMQITINTQKDIDWPVVESFLFKKTDLQKNHNANIVVINNKKPQQMGLVDILQDFATFKISLYEKSFSFELEKNQNRLEIVKGLIRVTDVIDEIIKIIRKSTGKADAKTKIQDSFGFTVRQAEAIVSLRLYRLSSTDVNALKEEEDILQKNIEHFTQGLENRNYLVNVIVQDLEELNKSVKVSRKTQIDADVVEFVDISEKALVKEEETVIVVTHQGYIKKSSKRSMQSAPEGTLGLRSDDIPLSIIETTNLKTIVLFAASGRFFTIPILKLAEFKWKDLGEHVSQWTSIDGLDRIVKVEVIDEDHPLTGNFIVSTAKGQIKQFKAVYMVTSTSKRGAKFMGLKSDDKVVSVEHVKNDSFSVISITEQGMMLRYEQDQVPTVGLNAAGVKNMNLNEGDSVVATITANNYEVDSGKAQAIVFTTNGKVKRFRISEVKNAARGSKGSMFTKQIKTNPHYSINMFNVSGVDSLNLITSNEERKTIIPTKDVKLTGFTEGLTLIDKAGISIIMGNRVEDTSSNAVPVEEMNEQQTKEQQIKIEDILAKI